MRIFRYMALMMVVSLGIQAGMYFYCLETLVH